MGMAERIKERRIAMGLTQEELASRLGLQKSAIAKYEKGRVENIKRSIIQRMSEILECSPCYLMGFTENDEPYALDGRESHLVSTYRNLSLAGKRKVTKYADNIYEMETAEQEVIAAHERTDVPVDKDAVLADNAIMNDEDF